MTRLLIGVLLWSLTHFIPAVAVDFKNRLITKLGENPYKGLFTLLMLLSIYLIISGWRATIPELVYAPPAWGRTAGALLVLIGFVLFVASFSPNNFKRILRHPQLTGLACWGAGHLLANGDSRSVVLFGGLTVWAIVQIILLNRRDGDWIRPGKVSLKKDISPVLVGFVVYLVFVFAHRWLFGVSPLA